MTTAFWVGLCVTIISVILCTTQKPEWRHECLPFLLSLSSLTTRAMSQEAGVKAAAKGAATFGLFS